MKSLSTHPRRKSDGKIGNKLNILLKEYSAVQLATLVDRPPEGDQWLHEIKFDGYRLLAFLADGNRAPDHAQWQRLDTQISRDLRVGRQD